MNWWTVCYISVRSSFKNHWVFLLCQISSCWKTMIKCTGYQVLKNRNRKYNITVCSLTLPMWLLWLLQCRFCMSTSIRAWSRMNTKHQYCYLCILIAWTQYSTKNTVLIWFSMQLNETPIAERGGWFAITWPSPKSNVFSRTWADTLIPCQ